MSIKIENLTPDEFKRVVADAYLAQKVEEEIIQYLPLEILWPDGSGKSSLFTVDGKASNGRYRTISYKEYFDDKVSKIKQGTINNTTNTFRKIEHFLIISVREKIVSLGLAPDPGSQFDAKEKNNMWNTVRGYETKDGQYRSEHYRRTKKIPKLT